MTDSTPPPSSRASLAVRESFPRTPFRLEPAFVEAGFDGARLADLPSSESLAAHLARKIRRTPTDLALHVTRAMFACRTGDAAAACAALADLATVLGDRGRDLRRTLFHRVSGAMTEDQRRSAEPLLGRAPDESECAAIPGTVLVPARPPAALVIRRDSSHAGASEAEAGNGL